MGGSSSKDRDFLNSIHLFLISTKNGTQTAPQPLHDFVTKFEATPAAEIAESFSFFSTLDLQVVVDDAPPALAKYPTNFLNSLCMLTKSNNSVILLPFFKKICEAISIKLVNLEKQKKPPPFGGSAADLAHLTVEWVSFLMMMEDYWTSDEGNSSKKNSSSDDEKSSDENRQQEELESAKVFAETRFSILESILSIGKGTSYFKQKNDYVCFGVPIFAEQKSPGRGSPPLLTHMLSFLAENNPSEYLLMIENLEARLCASYCEAQRDRYTRGSHKQNNNNISPKSQRFVHFINLYINSPYYQSHSWPIVFKEKFHHVNEAKAQYAADGRHSTKSALHTICRIRDERASSEILREFFSGGKFLDTDAALTNDASCLDSGGMSPLMCAAELLHVEVIRELIANNRGGCDLFLGGKNNVLKVVCELTAKTTNHSKIMETVSLLLACPNSADTEMRIKAFKVAAKSNNSPAFIALARSWSEYLKSDDLLRFAANTNDEELRQKVTSSQEYQAMIENQKITEDRQTSDDSTEDDSDSD
jgi:hypothetical protein